VAGTIANGAALVLRRRCHVPSGHLHGLICRRVEEQGLHCACRRRILCGVEGDHPRHFEEQVGLSMASLAQNAEVPQVRRNRVFGPHVPATLVVLIDCMGGEGDDCSFEYPQNPTSPVSY
jgi:hypothetical protein